MRTAPRFGIVIPACNEAEALPKVLQEWRAAVDSADLVIGVGANGCTDDTAALAREFGAVVGETAQRGYGFGCRAAIEALTQDHPSLEAFIFVAADGASSPADLGKFLEAFAKGHRVILGQRTRHVTSRREMGVRHVLANRLLGAWCGLLTSRFYADLGPYRLIARDVFELLQMQEWTYGWTIEPQILCPRLGIPVLEIDVAEHRRIAGEQKVSRVSWRRTLQIGCQIFVAGWRSRFRPLPLPAQSCRPNLPVPYPRKDSPNAV